MRKIYYFNELDDDGCNGYISIKGIGNSNLVEIHDKLGYRTKKNVTKEHFENLLNALKQVNNGIYSVVTL